MIPKQDRLPYPGRERFRSFNVMESDIPELPVGSNFVAQMDFADDATQLGTPVNRASQIEYLAASGVTQGGPKAFTLSQQGFELTDGAFIRARFNAVAETDSEDELPTLNVEYTGDYGIYSANRKNPAKSWEAGAWVSLVFSSAWGGWVMQAAGTGEPPKPTRPVFSYTGNYTIFDSIHPINGSGRFYMALYTSGTFMSDMTTTVDVFLVNGGNGGAKSTTAGGNGGTGGKLSNYNGIEISKNVGLSAIVGSGGAANSGAGGATSFLGNTPSGTGGAYGTGGAVGTSVGATGNAGSAALTKAFGGAVAPFNSMSFSGGGGGGGGSHTQATSGNSAPGGNGGAGGGGRGGVGSYGGPTITSGTAGTVNTGGGGGGGGGYSQAGGISGSAGGSGIILIRWGDWTA